MSPLRAKPRGSSPLMKRGLVMKLSPINWFCVSLPLSRPVWGCGFGVSSRFGPSLDLGNRELSRRSSRHGRRAQSQWLWALWHVLSLSAHPLPLPTCYVFVARRERNPSGGACSREIATLAICVNIWLPPGVLREPVGNQFGVATQG